MTRPATLPRNVAWRGTPGSLLLAVLLAGCAERDAPAQPARTAETHDPPSPTASTAAAATAAASGEAPPAVLATAVPDAAASDANGVDTSGPTDANRSLPQTEARPTTDDPQFRGHAEGLFRAIVADDPNLALPFFFPVSAYQQVKDVAKPERDWKLRLVAHLGRDVHEYHRKLGKAAAEARFVALEVPEPRVRWMKPGSEGNKVGYFRVLGSRLRFENARGHEESLEVTSLISWRGEWYLVHLHGFE